jgi:hypothetical protein
MGGCVCDMGKQYTLMDRSITKTAYHRMGRIGDREEHKMDMNRKECMQKNLTIPCITMI